MSTHELVWCPQVLEEGSVCEQLATIETWGEEMRDTDGVRMEMVRLMCLGGEKDMQGNVRHVLFMPKESLESAEQDNAA